MSAKKEEEGLELTNRELASLFWSFLLLAVLLVTGDARSLLKGFQDLLIALVAPILLGIYFLVFGYVFLTHHLFEYLSPWPNVPTKNFIYWFVAAILVTLHQKHDGRLSPLKKFLIDSFGLAVLFEYFLTLAEFPLWVEMITVPSITLVVGLPPVS